MIARAEKRKQKEPSLDGKQKKTIRQPFNTLKIRSLFQMQFCFSFHPITILCPYLIPDLFSHPSSFFSPLHNFTSPCPSCIRKSAKSESLFWCTRVQTSTKFHGSMKPLYLADNSCFSLDYTACPPGANGIQDSESSERCKMVAGAVKIKQATL